MKRVLFAWSLIFLAGCGNVSTYGGYASGRFASNGYHLGTHPLTTRAPAGRAYPAYCDSIYYANTLACAGANPLFCASVYYANAPACAGAFPAYCDSPLYANALACLP